MILLPLFSNVATKEETLYRVVVAIIKGFMGSGHAFVMLFPLQTGSSLIILENIKVYLYYRYGQT